MRTWIEGLRIETLIDRDERRLFNALIAETGETIEGEAATSWSQPDRRPYTSEGRLSFYGAPGAVFPPGVAPTFGRWGSGRRAPHRP